MLLSSSSVAFSVGLNGRSGTLSFVVVVIGVAAVRAWISWSWLFWKVSWIIEVIVVAATVTRRAVKVISSVAVVIVVWVATIVVKVVLTCASTLVWVVFAHHVGTRPGTIELWLEWIVHAEVRNLWAKILGKLAYHLGQLGGRWHQERLRSGRLRCYFVVACVLSVSAADVIESSLIVVRLTEPTIRAVDAVRIARSHF